MSNKLPLVSIITVVYNGEKYLKETIESILCQTYENVEYIIIDGGSTDGTVDIIREYSDKISYWVSEPDNGIYDAMNKGLAVANGEYIAILNADDYYLENAVEVSISKILDTKSDYSFANVKYVNSQIMIRPIFPLKQNMIYQEMPYPHVSAFISRDIYKSIGLFDTKFKIAGDHDMATRIHLEGYKYCYIDSVIAELEAGGISSCSQSNRESLDVVIKNGKNKFSAWGTYFSQVSKTYTAKFLPKKVFYFLQKLKKSRFQ